MSFVYLAMILLLAIFLGFELIRKVPATLHTPLMSGANAISGITLIGAFVFAGGDHNGFSQFLGVIAVFLATINVVGGYLVTDRMLAMFKGKADGKSAKGDRNAK
jgi:NAD(P) transhydrogenase subunit alpha